jgi:hypothetical protein
MQFKVPQFIDVEDKLFGPLTFKQFAYLGGGAGLVYIIFRFLPGFLAFIVGAPVVLFSLALAFYKINGKPFIFIVNAWINYKMQNKLYLWKKTEQKQTAQTQVDMERDFIPKLSNSKLKDLSWNLDVKDMNKTTEE